MYKIGDFAKLTKTSIRTLRFYDKIDLFKPEEIDLFTNYRYYSESQLEEFKLILKLKDLGFSLDEIKKYRNNLTEQVLLDKKKELMETKDNIDSKIKQLDMMRSKLTKPQKTKVLKKEMG